MDIKEQHEKMFYPTVRIRADKAMGSGTVIYSELIPGKDLYESYVLTNCHVVDGNIGVVEEWSPLLQRNVKRDSLKECEVEFFEWDYGSWEGGSRVIRACIQCYHKEQDLALLKLQSSKKIDYVASLFPPDDQKERLRVFMKVFAVGCGLGHPTLATEGQLNGFNDVIDNYPYIISSAPTIFGNSGGSLYLAETGELIGIPARIAVTRSMLGMSAITHLSFSIPIWTFYKFLDEQIFDFIYKDDITSVDCEKKRKQRREKDEEDIKDKESK